MVAARRASVEVAHLLCLTTLLLLIVPTKSSPGKNKCPFEISNKIPGFRLTGKQRSIKCATIYKRNGRSIDGANDFCQEAFGNESKRFNSKENTNKIKIANANAFKVRLILDKLDETESCQVYEGGTVVNKTGCGQNDWNSFACIHQLINFCEPVGTCNFHVNTSTCTFTFVHFRWNVAHSDFDPCEKPKECWCDPCANTEWTKWKKEKKTRVIVRYRAMNNSTQSDCESEGKFCCRMVIDKCENGGQLNTKKTRCTCKPGYSGIVCETTRRFLTNKVDLLGSKRQQNVEDTVEEVIELKEDENFK